MKRIFVLASVLCISGMVIAQNEETAPVKPGKEERITIIKKKAGDQKKLTIVVDGDNITVNGEPLESFKDSSVTIFKGPGRGNGIFFTPGERRELQIFPNREGGVKMFGEGFPFGTNKALLGVITTKDEKGAKVSEITKESPAEKAGLQKDDIITQVGKVKIHDANDLYKEIGHYSPGDTVSVTYLRNGKGNITSVILGENKVSRNFSLQNRNFNFDMPDFRGFNQDGFNFYRSTRPSMGIKIQNMEDGNGLKILDVNEDSPAAKAGLQKDDIILAIDGKEVKDVDDLRSKLRDSKEGDSFDVKYKRGDQTSTVLVKFPRKIKTADL